MKSLCGKHYKYYGICIALNQYVFVCTREGYGLETLFLESARLEVAPNVFWYFNPMTNGKPNIKKPQITVPKRAFDEDVCYSKMKRYDELVTELAIIKDS